MSNQQKVKKGNKRNYVICQIFIYLFLFICTSLVWERLNFGGVDLASIYFTLTMPLEGASSKYIISYLLKGPLLALGLLLIEMIFFKVFIKYISPIIVKKTFIKEGFFRLTTKKTVIFSICLFLLSFGVLNYFLNVSEFVKNQIVTSKFIENNYSNPSETKLVFPKKKMNIVHIYLESGESTLQDKQNGGEFNINYIPEMTALEKNNISFSNNNAMKGAHVTEGGGFTTGGMVAQECGLPMKTDMQNQDNINKAFSKANYFLPGATSIGDILYKEGYNNFYACDQNWAFGGIKSYYEQHGKYKHLDYWQAVKEGKISEDYFEWWGFEDEKLYKYAKEKVLALANKNKPFNFTMATMDTHQLDGFVCDLCKKEHEDQYGNVWSCASRQVYDFVEWLKKQPFYNNTVIVITGDHCSMAPTFFKKHDIDPKQRFVYNTFINSKIKPQKEKNRRFTTLDIYPTMLAAMGVKIEGNKLGLGVNLFSDKKTLSEEYGYEYLDKELKKKSKFYNDNIMNPENK